MSTLYLLDANVLIRAHEDYYPIDRIPQFWAWLADVSSAGHVKIPYEIYHEISVSTGPLSDWITSPEVKDALLLEEEAERSIVQRVLDEGYAPDLSDDEILKVGRDPFLIAYALMLTDTCIVTKEVSKPGKQRANRKIPDICDSFDVKWLTDFDFYKEMDFSIK